jgi:predicted NUDIX family NTP pyrophosphohydrolase
MVVKASPKRLPQTAGLLIYRMKGHGPEVLLVHPGGPFWSRKDTHAWSIPKGEFGDDEEPLAAARREVAEETGLDPQGPLTALQPIRRSGHKTIHAWAIESDCDPSVITSNSFSMEWPPKSGRMQEFPEVDRAAWFPLDVAKAKIHKGQRDLLDQLERRLASAA